MSPTKPKRGISKNAREVYWAWKLGEERKETLACWTDGEAIYSYDYVIMVGELPAKKVIINQAHLGCYTAPYQSALTLMTHEDGLSTRVVIVPRELCARPVDLYVAAGDEAPPPTATPGSLPELGPVASELIEAKNPALYKFNPEVGF